MFSLSTHSHKNLSCKAVFSGSAFSMWFLLPQVQDFAIPFLELVGPFLLPFKVPLSSNTTSSHYPHFVYSASLLSVHSASPPRPLMKMNYTGSSIICWVAPLVACLHLVFMSQIIAFQVAVQPVSSHLTGHLSGICLRSGSMRMLWETVKALLKSRLTTATALLSSSEPIKSSQESVRLARHDFFFLNLIVHNQLVFCI